MKNSNKKAPIPTIEAHNEITTSILSDWNKRVNQSLIMISEINSIRQLDCLEQELKEEGLSFMYRYTQQRRKELC